MFKPVSLTSLVLAFALAFASGFTPAFPALADTTPPKKKPAVTRQIKHHVKHHVKRWTTPPGYRSPREIERDEYKAWRRDRAFAWRHNAPRAYYYYYGPPYYNGRFGANRYDSLHVGPCWTQTPIGAMWNCGK